MWIFWLIIVILMVVLEAATINMVSIWFAIGALAAMIADLFTAEFIWQLVIFLVVSGLGLWIFISVFKPRLKKKGNQPVSTNADRIIGQEALVISDIVPLEEKGQIKVLGQVWSALSEDENLEIPRGTKVRVVRLDSIRAVVRPCEEEK
ncbi:MAG: NfeD family protein [Eubacteriales bacterium]|nr:NfeD family protein [Eubacteriales bacterium]